MAESISSTTNKTTTESETRLLEVCQQDLEAFSHTQSHDELLVLLRQEELRVDTTDENGMTALMHSAYHGNTAACRLLLEHQADVNCNSHSDGYSALMFATIAGHPDTVHLLLEAGAQPSATNKIGKTAAVMGSFLGQHACARIINNFFSVADLEYYTKPRGVEKVAKLEPSLASPLHRLVSITSLHPIKIMLFLDSHGSLLECHKQVCRVMGLIAEKNIKQQREPFALKMHYLTFVIRNHVEKREETMRLLLTQRSDGVAVQLDQFLRQCLREFPFTHSPLLKQMVAALAKIPPGGTPSALMLFHNAILGRKSEEEAESCSTCGDYQNVLKKCSKCKQMQYCSVDCQALAWKVGNHKTLCKSLSQTLTTSSSQEPSSSQ